MSRCIQHAEARDPGDGEARPMMRFTSIGLLANGPGEGVYRLLAVRQYPSNKVLSHGLNTNFPF